MLSFLLFSRQSFLSVRGQVSMALSKTYTSTTLGHLVLIFRTELEGTCVGCFFLHISKEASRIRISYILPGFSPYLVTSWSFTWPV